MFFPCYVNRRIEKMAGLKPAMLSKPDKPVSLDA
jgi:hypothetical protein